MGCAFACYVFYYQEAHLSVKYVVYFCDQCSFVIKYQYIDELTGRLMQYDVFFCRSVLTGF